MVNQDAATETAAASAEEIAARKEVNQGKYDLLAGVVMFLSGLFVTEESLRMPTQQLSGSAWYTMPGTFPAVLGVLLVATSFIMIVASYRKSGMIRGSDLRRAAAFLKSRYTFRLCLALALLLAYIFLMLGRMHYMLATFLYLTTNLIVFDRKKASGRNVAVSIVISAVAALAVGYLFRDFAQIPLP